MGQFTGKYGAAPPGKQWHHIVPQNGGANEDQFGAEEIHNTKNLALLPTFWHEVINDYYRTPRPELGGLTPMQYIADKPYSYQYQYGLAVMRRHGVMI